MVKDEDPYGVWCAIASDLRRAIEALKDIGLKEDYLRSEFIDLIDKCLVSK